MLEYIIQLDKILADIKRAGGIVLGTKYYFLIDYLEVFRYKVSLEGRHPNTYKV
jgi:hypothetical protein